MTPLVLSLFPGIGLLDMAFEQEGFCVVRGPDLLWGGDVKRFHPPAGKFDGVIGGPPCQAFSELERLNEAQRRKGMNIRRAENLIPEFVRCVVEAQPDWFLMENVPNAPTPTPFGYAPVTRLLRDVWAGGLTARLRRFTFGTDQIHWNPSRFVFELEALCVPNPAPAVIAASGGRTPRYHGRDGGLKRRYQGGEIYKTVALTEAKRLQGLSADFLDEAPLTQAGKRLVIGNGVPLPMGRAVAKAVKQAMNYQLEATA